jgi:hypothetical protein
MMLLGRDMQVIYFIISVTSEALKKLIVISENAFPSTQEIYSINHTDCLCHEN